MIRIAKDELYSGEHELWIDSEDRHFVIRDSKRYNFVGNSSDEMLFLEVPVGSMEGCKKIECKTGSNG